MRQLLTALTLLATTAAPAAAQEGAAESPGLMSPNPGLMVWTILIFVALFLVLRRFAFPPILEAVEARERALEEAIEGAKRDRAEAERILKEQRAALEQSRGEAQRLLAEGRAAAERMRADLLGQARAEAEEAKNRALRDIEAERERAIADLRREAVDLALAGASKVIERNLDDASNRQLVESFLSSVSASPASAAGGSARR
jgi:F-type H+-transporting ATPase subunit b